MPTPWRDHLPSAGPAIVFDIDGVVATMIKYEHLLAEAPTEWDTFHRRYGRAAPIARGARLTQDALAAGLQVVWSTTRPDAASAITWRWLERVGLPQGPIMTRHFVKDGEYRNAIDVKLRHWFWWRRNYGDRNPIVAWIDDESSARDALRGHGCPSWSPMQLQRAIVKSRGMPLPQILVEQGPTPEELEKSLERRYDAWQAREDAHQEKRSRWWQQIRTQAAERRKPFATKRSG